MNLDFIYGIKFNDEKHEELFLNICGRMSSLNCYSLPAAYLLSLDCVLREHIDDVFNFDENIIKIEGLNKGWQTGTSKKTTHLLFNLWNGICSDEDFEVSASYAVDVIFCSPYAPYYWEAIKLRYPQYTVEN